MPIKDQSEVPTEASAYFKVYAEYAKVLRAWLVAYGVGGPLLFVANESIYTKMAKVSSTKTIVYIFFLGVALQIFITVLNKYLNWYLHYGEINPKIKKQAPYKISYWVSDQIWIDILCDLGAIGAFWYATLKVIIELSKAAI